jgi:hypothetical protein
MRIATLFKHTPVLKVASTWQVETALRRCLALIVHNSESPWLEISAVRDI